jgi:2-polyprenyl-6-methoxyphenol hydroxylase-like FAD-dependent oxidoreductase
VEFSLGDGCFFGLCSVGDGRTYGFGNASVERTYDPEDGRLARLRERFAHFGGSVAEFLAALERDDQIHCSPIEWLEEPAWFRGRVVLIGDASHAASPMLGQGGSLAMEDSLVLAECLRKEDSVDAALAAYVDRRRSRVEWVQQQSRAAGDAIGLPPAVRNNVLRERGADMLRSRFDLLRAEP